MEYRVVWEIDIDAKSYKEAARIAREMQLDPNSIATIFKVSRKHRTMMIPAVADKVIDVAKG